MRQLFDALNQYVATGHHVHRCPCSVVTGCATECLVSSREYAVPIGENRPCASCKVVVREAVAAMHPEAHGRLLALREAALALLAKLPRCTADFPEPCAEVATHFFHNALGHYCATHQARRVELRRSASDQPKTTLDPELVVLRALLTEAP